MAFESNSKNTSSHCEGGPFLGVQQLDGRDQV
jgi:hypothetical protein